MKGTSVELCVKGVFIHTSMLQVLTQISEAAVNKEIEQTVVNIILHTNKQIRLFIVLPLNLLFTFVILFKVCALANTIHSIICS